MKTVHSVLLLAGLCCACLINGQEMALKTSSDEATPVVSSLTWENTNIDLGVIKQNNPVQVDFGFSNTSSQPVVVTDVSTSCGCTAAKHSDEPVKPGESSTITVTYTAKNPGVFHKTITVTTSANENPVALQLSGEVK